MIDLDNFSTFLPKCGRYGLFDSLEKIKKLIHDVELESVLSGYRDINVYYLNTLNYDDQIEYLVDKGLFFSPLARIKSFENFGHKHEIVEKLDGNTSIYGVVSTDVKLNKKFRDFYLENDDFNMGKMLGYPECCCRAFVDYTKRFPDPVFEIARNTPQAEINGGCRIKLKDIPWKLQVHLRYFNLKVIPFLPCNFGCEEADSVSEEWYRMMKEKDPETLKILESLMIMPSTWSLYNSQVIVNKPPFESSEFIGYAASGYYPTKLNIEFLM